MKLKNFQGELTDITAKKEALVYGRGIMSENTLRFMERHCLLHSQANHGTNELPNDRNDCYTPPVSWVWGTTCLQRLTTIQISKL